MKTPVKVGDYVHVVRVMISNGTPVAYTVCCRVLGADAHGNIRVSIDGQFVWYSDQQYMTAPPNGEREYCQFVANVPSEVLSSMLPREERWKLNVRVEPFEMGGQTGSVIKTADAELFETIKARYGPRPVTDDTDDYDSLPSSLDKPVMGGEG